MTIFNCDAEHWPICLYDFTYKNKIPQYLSFRTQTDLSLLLKENYFDGNFDPSTLSVKKTSG